MCTPSKAPDPQQTVRDGYDAVADAYSHLEHNTQWPRMRWLRKMLALLDSGSSVLDIGCGSALPAGPEITRQHHLTGVDISEAQIKRAIVNVPKGAFICSDLGSVSFAPGAFDAATSFYTLEHVPREEHSAVFRRVHRWLAPGGLFLFSMEAGDYKGVWGQWLGVPMFLSCFPPERTRSIVVQEGFKILESAIEMQREGETEIPYHWLLARKC